MVFGSLLGGQEVRCSITDKSQRLAFCCVLCLQRVVEFSSSRDGLWRACSVMICWEMEVLDMLAFSLMPTKCVYLN